MRNNYEIAAKNAAQLFLKWDSAAMAKRCGLKIEVNKITISFLKRNYTVNCETGKVLRDDGTSAEFSEIMSIYDLLCRDTELPRETGNMKATHALSYAGVSSPSENKLSSKTAEYLQNNIQWLDAALETMKQAEFPIGDHAVVYQIFDCMKGVFQFWEGDEEFPPAICYLWDETAPTRLRFETLWYVMGCFEKRLISEIEKAKLQ